MYLDAQDSLKLGQYGYYEPEETALIKQLVKPTDVCIDVGAHIGYFTLLMAQRCKKVYSFEPDIFNFDTLEKNIQKINNVVLYQAAALNFNGQKALYRSDSNSGMHRMYQSKWYGGGWCDIVKVIRLDEILSNETIDFIKMDIEGAELGALKGMQYILKNNHPTLLMEFCPQYIEEYGVDPQEEYQFLKALGYDIRLLPDKDTSISFADLERETRKEPTGRNVLCVKP